MKSQKPKKKETIRKGVKLLILSDLLIYFGLGLISPILSIFIKDNLIGGTIAMAGLAAALFLLIKSVSQIIFSRIFNPKDRFRMVVIGSALIAAAPFIYAYSTSAWHVLFAQLIYGLGAGLASPAWMSLFILNVSKKRPGFEWSVYSTIVGLGAGAAAYIGASLVDAIGFKTVFFITGILALCGMLVLLKLADAKMK